MPKLLDIIKEKGLTHKEVIELIEKTDLPESQEDEADIPEEEIVEDDKPDDTIELRINDMTTEEEPEVPEEEKEITIELTEKELQDKIDKAIEDKIKANRKVPSKGKIVDKPVSNIAVIKKNWFEEIV